MKDGEPISRYELAHDDDFSIVARYGAEYRGIVQYYAYARNRFWLNRSPLGHVEITLQDPRREAQDDDPPTDPAVSNPARSRKRERSRCASRSSWNAKGNSLWSHDSGVFPSHPNRPDVIDDVIKDRNRIFIGHNEIVQRLLADECELCGSKENVEVHHIRKLADLKIKGRT